MAATGKTPILLYGSTTATNVPVAGNLTNSSDGCEIAINVADKNLFFKDSTNAVNTVPIRQSSGSSDGWLSSANWTTFNSKQAALVSGTNIKTVSGTTLLGSGDLGTIGTGYGGTGLTSFTSGGIPYATSTSALTTNSNFTFDGSLLKVYTGYSSSVDYSGLRLTNGGENGTNIDFYNAFGPLGQIAVTKYAGGSSADEGKFVLRLATNSVLSDVVSVDYFGNTTLSTGNLVIGTSGKGIDFSATAGTGTSELLADYEEGTWTPTDASGAGLTLTASGCTYVKIGKLVTLYGFITYPATASAATVLIGGIPYANATNNNGTTAPWTNNSLAYTVISTLTQLFLRTSANADLTNAQMSGKFVAFSVTYQAST